MKYFVIKYCATQKGCPLVLKGDLSSEWEWDEFDPEPDKFKISSEFVYQTKHPLIEFDCWNSKCLISDRFLSFLNEYNASIRTIPVKMIQSNKHETKKNYYYVLWRDWIACMDNEVSIYEIEKDLESGNEVRNHYFPDSFSYEKIEKFVVDPKKTKEKEIFKSVELFSELICSEKLADQIEKRGFVGIELVPVDEFKLIPFWAS